MAVLSGKLAVRSGRTLNNVVYRSVWNKDNRRFLKKPFPLSQLGCGRGNGFFISGQLVFRFGILSAVCSSLCVVSGSYSSCLFSVILPGLDSKGELIDGLVYDAGKTQSDDTQGAQC